MKKYSQKSEEWIVNILNYKPYLNVTLTVNRDVLPIDSEIWSSQ